MNSKLDHNLKVTVILMLIFTFLIILPEKSNIDLPTPTEYIKKKKDRKEFKKHRKEWMENMHRSAPDTDWSKMDAESRKLQTKLVNLKRQELKLNGLWRENQSYHEQIGNRDLTGVWNERGSNNLAGRIHTADVDLNNGLIYCGSSGGNIWRGTINGGDWVSLNDHMQIPDIKMVRVQEFNETRRILICGGKSFYYSDDEGFTINESQGLSFSNDWGWAVRSIIKNDGSNRIYLLAIEWDYVNWNAMAAVYKSIDNGETFEKIITFADDNGYDIWTSRYESTDVYLIHNGSVYTISNSDELVDVGSFFTFASGDNLLTGGVSDSEIFLYARIDERIYFSPDGGISWEDKGIQPQWTFMINSFNSSNIHSNIITLGGMEVFFSNNSGTSWDLVNHWYDYYNDPASLLHADIPEIRFFLDNNGEEFVLISTDGGIYASYDYFENNENLSLEGLGVSQYYSTYTKRTNPYHIYAGSQDQGFQRSTGDNGGILEFEQSISGDYGHLVSGDGGESIWCNYPGFTMFYDNPQVDTYGMMLDFPGSNYMWLAPLVEHPYDPNKAYLGGGGVSDGNHLVLLTANAFSITYEELDYNFNARISGMAYSSIDPSVRYVITENGSFYYSLDSGSSWTQTENFSGPTPQYFYGATIYPSPINVNEVIIGGSGYDNPPVYKSENFGESFFPMHTGLPSTLVYDIAGNVEGDLLFAATEVGPYIYESTESQWSYLGGISAPDQTYWSVDYIPELQTARFGTYGRGIWDFVLDDNYGLILGDVNNDMIINVQDIIILVNFILNILEPNDDQLWSADMNSDGEINILDVVGLVNLILGN